MTFEIDKEGTEKIIEKIKKLDDKAIIEENENGFISVQTSLMGYLTRYEQEHYLHIYDGKQSGLDTERYSVNVDIEFIETIWGLWWND